MSVFIISGRKYILERHYFFINEDGTTLNKRPDTDLVYSIIVMGSQFLGFLSLEHPTVGTPHV
jgi:hypothetical protein